MRYSLLDGTDSGPRSSLRRVLFLSVHAWQRMQQRGISRAEVLEALANRETVVTAAGDDSVIVVLGRTAAGRRLKLVVNAADEEHVITVAGRDEED